MSEPARIRHHVVIGTSGHIDHGKTALIRALTGIDTDRAPEEKRRGITIDLGFASLDLPGPAGGPLQVSFVDVPGHHAFIRNMLAGAGGIDAVMLVISAEEGIKPQTEEHLAICSLLGIARGLTVLTKTELVGDERLQRVTIEVQNWLADSFLAGTPVVPVSAFTGKGLQELQGRLVQLAAGIPLRSSVAVPRLPIDRAFAIKGFGTVVTGTLHSGTIKLGDTLALEPSGLEARVRGIQTHGVDKVVAEAGSRVALNLAGVGVQQIQRGDTATPLSSLHAVPVVDAEITLLPDAATVEHGMRLRLHAFSSESLAHVALYGYKPISGGGVGFARLRLAKPLLLLPGDRFVLRQCSPAKTIGGGRVLDASPLPKLKRAACLEWLEKVQLATLERQLLLRVARRGTAGITMSELVTEMGATEKTLRAWAQPMLGNSLLAASPERLLAAEAFQQVKRSVFSQMGTASPLKRSEISSRLRLDTHIVAFALSALAGEGKLQLRGDDVELPGAGDGLSEGDLRQLTSIEQTYAAAGLAPPLLRDVCEQLKVGDTDRRRLMTLLLRRGSIVKLTGEQLYIHSSALAGLYRQIGSLRGQELDVPHFKKMTGLSRKHAIPLLEHLDHKRMTRREGETRIVL